MKPRAAGGFTLIEVLVALVIVALGMGALMSALTSSADATMRLREKSFAEWVGLNQLAAARLGRGVPALGKSEGDVDFAGRRWHWLQQVSAMQVPGVVRIEIQVRQLPGAAREDGTQASAAAAGATSNAQGASGEGPVEWLANVTGFRGAAIASPQGTFGEWDNPPSSATGAGQGNGPAPVPVTQGTAK